MNGDWVNAASAERVWPDCSAKHRAGRAKLQAMLQYNYYNGTCETMKPEIIAKFRLKIGTILKQQCAFINCSLTNITVHCGENSRRKRDANLENLIDFVTLQNVIDRKNDDNIRRDLTESDIDSYFNKDNTHKQQHREMFLRNHNGNNMRHTKMKRSLQLKYIRSLKGDRGLTYVHLKRHNLHHEVRIFRFKRSHQTHSERYKRNLKTNSSIASATANNNKKENHQTNSTKLFYNTKSGANRNQTGIDIILLPKTNVQTFHIEVEVEVNPKENDTDIDYHQQNMVDGLTGIEAELRAKRDLGLKVQKTDISVNAVMVRDAAFVCGIRIYQFNFSTLTLVLYSFTLITMLCTH